MQISTHALLPDYDDDSDTLYLHSVKEKAAATVSFGNLAIDFAKDGGVVGLEFLNATSSLPPFLVLSHKNMFETPQRMKSEVLAHIKKANVSVHTAADLFIIAFTFHVDEQALEGRLNLPVPAQSQEEMLKILASP